MSSFGVFVGRLCLALGVFCAGIVAFGQQQEEEIPVVASSRVVRVEGVASQNYVGTVLAIEEVEVVARVAGTLEKRLFEEGAMVKEGDLLYELEDITYRSAVETLKANQQKAEAGLVLAEREFQRSENLLAKKVVTESEHDVKVCNLATAKASIEELKAQLINAENNLSYTKIHAPLSGMISRSNYSEGNLVNPSCGALATIRQMAPIYVRFNLSQKVFQRDFGGMNGIRENAVVKVKLADGTPYGETAAVTLVDNKINPTTDTITLWATFQNADLALLPGAYVTVQVTSKLQLVSNAVVPSALMTQPDGTYAVYVVGEGGIVELRPVELGGMTTNGLQVVTKGLSEGEVVVSDGQNKVMPGQKCAAVRR